MFGSNNSRYFFSSDTKRSDRMQMGGVTECISVREAGVLKRAQGSPAPIVL